MAYNYPLRYFFLSILPEQVEIIRDLIDDSKLEKRETKKLMGIFSDFFNLKGNSDNVIAENIIRD